MKDYTERYIHVRKETETRVEKLSPEDMVPQADVFVSPVKWHIGHTTWFFETFILKNYVPNYRVFDESFNFIFNSYYESIGERVNRNHRGMLFRPPVADIFRYRKYVDEAMVELLKNNQDAELIKFVELGLQHEQQHQELIITDTKYIFSHNPLFPVWDENKTLDKYRLPKTFDWLTIPEGVYEIGHQDIGFSFDNELGVHKQYIRATQIMDRPVTNGEYVEFINDGGYNNAKYWLSEAWDWVKTEKITSPMYWYNENGQYKFFHLDGLKPLDLDLPLMHISYFEADAFARWKGLRLPTEFEWETAARLHPQLMETNVWEWTGSAYLAYPNFQIAEGAVGEYNGKFMVNQMVLRGKSLATPEGHSRVTYRNFFPTNLQWQFSGMRLMK